MCNKTVSIEPLEKKSSINQCYDNITCSKTVSIESSEKKSSILSLIFDCINSSIELYLEHLISPFLTYHAKFYSSLNFFLRSLLDEFGIPVWCTANFITYCRTWLILPCLILLAKGYNVIPFAIVVFVDFNDFLDGVVARYWMDNKHIAKSTPPKKNTILSWMTSHQNKIYGGFIDAVCDKVFVVPCWIYLISRVEESTNSTWKILQYIALWCLILAETSSGAIRFRAFYTAPAVSSPKSSSDFSSSAVKADHVGKAKQTFEMLGTAFFIIPATRFIGFMLLVPAIPLAYESVRRKITTRVILVIYDNSVPFDAGMIEFWLKAKTLGSKLIIGVNSNTTDDIKVRNASSISVVDEIMVQVPNQVSTKFLQENEIDYVVCTPKQTKDTVMNDALRNGQCLCLCLEENTVKLVEAGKND